MFQDILNSSFIKGSRVLGVDYFISSNGQPEINCIILNKKKEKIFIEKRFSGINSVDQLSDDETKGLPLAISVDGKGVILKVTEYDKNRKLINHILPNANEDDFYIQSTPAVDNKMIISAIRKEIVHEIVENFKQAGFQIVNFYISALSIENFLGIIEDEKIFTNRYEVNKDSELIKSIVKLPEPNQASISIGDEEIYSNEVLSYATALSFYLSDTENSGLDFVTELAKEYTFKRLFTMAGWFTLAFFFILLMVNYFFYNNNNQNLNKLTFSFNQNRELIKKLDTLKNEYLIKEQYFVNSGFLDASKLSYYADRISYSLPSEIKLSVMNINPLNTKIKEEKPLGFSMNQITISGTVSQSIILNNWVKKLKKLDWVNNVNILEYNQDVANIPADFKLEIDLKQNV